MSANLWQAESVISSETQEGGIYACSGTRGVRTNVALDRLAENQAFHCGFSVNPGADDAFSVALCYRDAAGSVNYAFTPTASAPAGKWTRVGKSVVVPSGMTVYQMVVCNDRNASGASGWKVTNPTLSLGSPVCLASSAHTPYATEDHISATYATKASLKVTDDSIKAEVSARAQTDQNVADLSSRLTQTANSLTSEISDRKSAVTTVTGLANAAQSTADSASEQTVELSSRLDQTATDMTATIESKVQTVQQGVDGNASDVKDLNSRLSDEIRTRRSFMRFSEESSDPTLTLGQTDSPAQVKLTNKQLQFLYLNTVVAYMSGDALLINNAKILQQLQLGGFAFVPRDNGNLAFKWVGGDA